MRNQRSARPAGAGQDTRSLAREAYLQIEANVFDPGEIEIALQKLEDVRRRDPREPYLKMAESLAILVAGYTIGDWYEEATFAEGTVSRSRRPAEEAVALDPKLAEAHAHLARLYIVERKFSEAREAVDTAKALDEASFYPWYLEGILFEKLEDATEAKRALGSAELRAQYPHQKMIVSNHRQTVAALEGDPATQERLLLANIAANPTDPYVYGAYAMFLKIHERYDESIVQWQLALSRGRFRHAEEQLEKVKQLRAAQPQ